MPSFPIPVLERPRLERWISATLRADSILCGWLGDATGVNPRIYNGGVGLNAMDYPAVLAHPYGDGFKTMSMGRNVVMTRFLYDITIITNQPNDTIWVHPATGATTDLLAVADRVAYLLDHKGPVVSGDLRMLSFTVESELSIPAQIAGGVEYRHLGNRWEAYTQYTGGGG